MLTAEDLAIINTDYPRNQSTSEGVESHIRYHRGYLEPRLARGLYRTEAEQKEWIERGLAIKLPGCK